MGILKQFFKQMQNIKNILQQKYEKPNPAGPVKIIRPKPGPALIRLGPVDTSTVYVYVYIVYVYVVLTRVYAIMHRDVIIYAWETGKQSNYYSYTGLLQNIYCCHTAPYDFANAILYFASWGPPRVKVRGGAKEVGLSVRLECYQ